MTPPDDFDSARAAMVQDQLFKRGIKSERVLEAMGRMAREQFVTPDTTSLSYDDRALPIACEQTISQPYMVALMTEALDLAGFERVLEIGTGSGYQTAILSLLAADVTSIERHPQLSAAAGRALAAWGCRNVTLVVGDGTLGWPAGAPYDAILVTAAASDCPPALFSQLGEGGSVVLPIGDLESQVLKRLRKVGGKPHAETLVACRFVPLIGVQGWPD